MAVDELDEYMSAAPLLLASWIVARTKRVRVGRAVLSTKVAFGTAPVLIDRFRQLKEELGLTGIAAELNPGGLLPIEVEMRSLQILTRQVMPALK